MMSTLGVGIRLVEKGMQNLENYNHNMANQIISILNSLNENIVPLARKLKTSGFQEDNEEKDKEKDRMEEDTITDITHSHLDWTYLKNHKKMVEEFQKAFEAVETM